MTAETPMVYVVDDDQSILKALGRLLAKDGHRFAGYSNAADFLREHDPEIPGCVVLDLHLPGIDGLQAQIELATDSPSRPVVFLTGYGTVTASVQAMKGGAVDFLTKPVEASTFLSAVSAALQRDLETRLDIEKRRSVERRIATLTPREREVLGGVLNGRLNKQIGGDLDIAVKTVKVHRSRMMNKMGVRTVAELAQLVSKFRSQTDSDRHNWPQGQL